MNFVQRAWIAIVAVAALTVSTLPSQPPAEALSSGSIIQTETASTPEPSASAGNSGSVSDFLIQSLTATPPVNSEPPVVALAQTTPPNPIAGTTISGSAGTWSGTLPISKKYQWLTCPQQSQASSSEPPDCEEIPGATRSVLYVPEPVDFSVNEYLVLRVTANNEATGYELGSGESIWSASTGNIYVVPQAAVAPEILDSRQKQSARQGDILTADLGSWVSVPEIAQAKTIQWISCTNPLLSATSEQPANCSTIAGAVGSTYQLKSGELGKYVTFRVTAKNLAGSSTHTAASTPQVSILPSTAGSPSVIDSATSKSPTSLRVGQLLKVAGANWAGTPTPTKNYQWLSCTSAVSSSLTAPGTCSEIVGATAATFSITNDQAGKFIIVGEFASNPATAGISPVSKYSASNGKVTPVNTSQVSISGTPLVGEVLTGNAGTWIGADDGIVAYQWVACSTAITQVSGSVPSSCVNISGATTNLFTLSKAQNAKHVALKVTKRNAGGETFQVSTSIGSINELPSLGVPKVIITNPVANTTTTPKVGSILKSSATVAGFPAPTVSRQWFSCLAQDLSDCVAIANATSVDFTIPTGYDGKHIYVEYTATNSVGQTVATSDVSNQILLAPAITSSPVLSGSTTVGSTITVAGHTANMRPVASPTYEWYSCTSLGISTSDAIPANCSKLSVTATSDSYVLGDALKGKFVRARVIYTNSVGSASRWSASTAVISTTPATSGTPTLGIKNGTASVAVPKLGYKISANAPVWTGTPVPTSSYAWYACETAHGSSSSVADDCVLVPGVTTSTWEIDYRANGKFLAAKVTGTNPAGELVKFTATTTAPSDADSANKLAASLGGTPEISITAPATRLEVGSTLQAKAVTFSGNPAPSKKYQWLGCETEVAAGGEGTEPADCVILATTTSDKWTITSAANDKYLLVKVSALNYAGPEVSKYSASTSVRSMQKPAMSTQPVLTGTAKVGQDVSANVGTWSGSTTDAQYLGSWLICTSAITNDYITTTNAIPSNCSFLRGGASNNPVPSPGTYTLTSAEGGKYVAFRTSATNNAGSQTRVSKTQLVAQSPENLLFPSVTVGSPASDGAPKTGGTVSTTGGTWKATPTETKTYQWYSCTSPVEVELSTVDVNCALITNAKSNSLSVTNAFSGKHLSVLVTSKNTYGTVTAFTKSVGPVAVAPAPSSSPSITGNTQVDVPLVAGTGVWSATDSDLITSIGWVRCVKPIAASSSATDPAGCSSFAGFSTDGLPPATVNYTPSALDVGFYLSVRVQVSNNAGTAVRLSASSAVVKRIPTSTTPHSIGLTNGASTTPDKPKVGSILTSNATSWIATPGVSSTTYQWFFCEEPVLNAGSEIPGDCVQINGAASKTFTIPASAQGQPLRGKYLISKQIGINSAGSGISIADSIGPIVDVPQVTEAPSIGSGQAKYPSGAPQANEGTWVDDENLTANVLTYQWLRCNSALTSVGTSPALPSGCLAISFPSSSSSTKNYSISTADRGKFLAFRVYATNAAGQTVRTTTTTNQVAEAAPSLGTPVPAIVERTKPWIARTISAANGTWKNAPVAEYLYQWYSCTNQSSSSEIIPTGCSAIADQTQKTYLVTADDQTKTLVVSVTAKNDFGSTTRFTQSTVQILQEPSVITPPTLSGTFLPQNPVTSTRGTWEGEGAISFTQQWWVCNSEIPADTGTKPAGCSVIPSQTGVSYVPTTSQIGKYVTMEERATNVTNEYVSRWAQARLVIAQGLTVKTLPVASVTSAASNKAPKVGGTVTSTPGAWTGTPAPTMGYNWLMCDAAVSASAVITVTEETPASGLVPPGCQSVVESSTANYIVEQATVGKYLAAVVTATNRVNSKAYRTSTLSGAVTSAPVAGDNTPSVSGPSHVGTQLQALTGSWIASPAPSHQYEWALCNSEVESSSNTLPSGCALIAKETSATYVVKSTNLGKFIIARVTASNFAGSSSKWTASTSAVSNGAAASKTPVINGVPSVGKTLTTDGGTWVGTPLPTKEYQWFSCTTEVSVVQFEQNPNCSEISGETQSSLTLTEEKFGDGYDLNGTFVTVRVTGLSSGGDSIIFPKTTSVISTIPSPDTAASVAINSPENNDSDPAVEGVPLTITPGVWNGTPTPSLTYQWYSCSRVVNEASTSKPSQCSIISGATSASFTPTIAQKLRAKYLVVQETGTNPASKIAGRTDSVWSASTNAVTAVPTNTAAPVVSVQNGFDATTPLVGGTVRSTAGTWDSFPSHVYDFQWFACTAAITATSTNQASICNEIEGAQSLNLTVPSDAVTKFLTMRVTASNSSGEKAKWAVSTKAVAETPSNVDAPTISKTSDGSNVAVGETLTANKGVWRGAPTVTYSYQWYRCTQETLTATNSIPAGCVQIPKATTSTYKPLRTDVAASPNSNYLSVQVFAKSANVTVSKWSSTTGVIKEEPLNIKPQTIKVNGGTTAGEPKVGGSVEMVPGQWYGDPAPEFSYQWLSCTSRITAATDSLPAGCGDIDGADTSSLNVTSELAGKFLVLAVTGSNILKTRTKWSASTLLVTETPAITGAPTVVGRPFVQGTLRADVGTWTGTRTPTFSYEWYTCPTPVASAGTTKPGACSLIPGATSSTYVVKSSNQGFILAKVRGTNSAGFAEKWTASTNEVVSTGPVNTVELNTVVTNGATVQGATVPKIGSTITGNKGTWVGTTTPTTTLQWFECTAPVLSSTYDQPENCIALGTPSVNVVTPLTVTTAMAGKYYTLLVTASNSIAQNIKRWSKSTGMVHEEPTIITQPTLSGNAEVAAVLTGTGGEWRGSPTPTYSYQWFVCDNPIAAGGVDKQPAKCFDRQVSGLSYTIREGDFGKYLSLRVIATNALKATTRFTATSNKVVSPPRVMAEPTVKIGTTTGETRPKVGGVVTTMGGTWSGSTPMAFTTHWFACDQEVTAPSDSLPEGCIELVGAPDEPKELFTLPREASNKYILVQVTADNGSVLSRWSRSTPYAAAAPPMPADDDHPSVTGELEVERILSGDVGTWISDPELVLVGNEPQGVIKEWYICSNAVPEDTFDLPTDCIEADSDAESQVGFFPNQYKVLPEDAGKFISFSVTVRNSAGQVTQMWTAAPNGIAKAPELVSSPRIVTPTSGASSGKFLVGYEVSIVDAVFTGAPVPTNSYLWFKCDQPVLQSKELSPEDQSAPVGCVEIVGSTNKSFIPTSSEVGKYLIVRVVASQNPPVGTSTVFSPTSSGQVAQAPTRTANATISGDNEVGAELRLNSSTWDTQTSAVTRIGWLICTQPVTDPSLTAVPNYCKQQSGATAATFTIPSSTTNRIVGGRYISAVETLSFSSFQKFDRIAISTDQIRESPSSAAYPALGGSFIDPLVGTTLSISEGSWYGFPTPVKTYSWYTCPSGSNSGVGTPSGCDQISGQSSSTLNVIANYNTNYIVGVVTATNSEGQAVSHSISTIRPVRQVPVNTQPPAVSGNANSGEILTITAGSWTASPAATTTYEWATCTTQISTAVATLPETCTKIANQTGNTLEVPRAAMGKRIVVFETATNGTRASTMSSVTTSIVTGSPVVVSGARFSSNQPIVGESYTVGQDTWSAYPEIQSADKSYVWYHCSSANGSPVDQGCSVIPGENTTSLIVSSDYNGEYLMAAVTASNGIAPSATSFTARSQAVLQRLEVTSPAVIVENSGTAITSSSVIFAGDVLKANSATWEGTNSSSLASYQWYYCSGATNASNSLPSGCVATSGRSSSITVLPGWAGKRLVVSETKSNSLGTVTRWSASTVVPVQEPVLDSSAPLVGETISVSANTVGTTFANTVTYLWYVCTSRATVGSVLPSGCSEISGETTSSLAISSAFNGKYLTASVTSANGNIRVASSPVNVVKQVPTNTNPVSVDGDEFVGGVLTATPGTWTGSPVPTVTRQWFSCTNDHFITSSSLPADCTQIPGQSGLTLTLTAVMAGKFILVRETANNGVPTVSSNNYMSSATTGAILQAPQVVTDVTVPSASPMVGDTVTATAGTWAGVQTPSLTYQWFACDAPASAATDQPGVVCTEIASATSLAYQVEADYVDKYLMIRETAENSIGISDRWSRTTGVVQSSFSVGNN